MKTTRVILWAAALLCWAGLMTRTALAGDASAVWSDLWRTPNQQGQALLDAGKPAAAAARFDDPRRRAYADIEAGAYSQAAKLLAPFHDPESEYNRGNALAEGGQLLAALSSYDAALKQAPGDKDIRHNRDVVERALRHQRQSGKSSSGGGRQGSPGQPQAGSGGGKGAGSHQSGGGNSQPGGGQSGSQGGAGRSGQSGQQAASPQASGAHGARAKDSRAQAQRDAAFAAGLQRRQQRQGKGSGTSRQQGSQQNGTSDVGRKSAGRAPETGRRVAGGTQSPKQKPETEQQLALDQWLRQIPDSPAGLLRRKFLIQHMMKDQGGADPPENTP